MKNLCDECATRKGCKHITGDITVECIEFKPKFMPADSICNDGPKKGCESAAGISEAMEKPRRAPTEEKDELDAGSLCNDCLGAGSGECKDASSFVVDCARFRGDVHALRRAAVRRIADRTKERYEAANERHITIQVPIGVRHVEISIDYEQGD